MGAHESFKERYIPKEELLCSGPIFTWYTQVQPYGLSNIKIFPYQLLFLWYFHLFTAPTPLLPWRQEVLDWHHHGHRLCHPAAQPVGPLWPLLLMPWHSHQGIISIHSHPRLWSTTRCFLRATLMWPLMRTAASANSATTNIYHSLVASVLVLSVWTHLLLTTILQRRWKEVGRLSHKLSSRGW